MSRKALVVIDIQNDITKHYRDIIDNINAAVDWAVESGMEVIYILHNNLSAGTHTFKPGTKGAELAPELKVVSDNIFVKTKANALTSEAFSAHIRENSINEFYIAGADAAACVKSTCFNMTKAGYTVHVISDCVTSYDLKKLPEMLAYYADKGCEVRTLARLDGRMTEQKMFLTEPSIEYDEQIQAFRKEFLACEDSMDGCGSLRRFDRTEDWLEQVESLRRSETVPPGFVPSTQYIYVRESDNKMVGVIQIRHYFNEFLEKYAGHIGYSVCPSERKKGYATQMLRLTLPECKRLGINRVLICCIQGNEGSRKTILNNGGKYESTVYLEEQDVYMERYWIDLAESGE